MTISICPSLKIFLREQGETEAVEKDEQGEAEASERQNNQRMSRARRRQATDVGESESGERQATKEEVVSSSHDAGKQCPSCFAHSASNLS